jgi:hypothetical protein
MAHFFNQAGQVMQKITPPGQKYFDPLDYKLTAAATRVAGRAIPPGPPPPPGVPNPNDALNAAQAQTDALRMRRGLLANIYGGAQNQQPVSGKTQLGG